MRFKLYEQILMFYYKLGLVSMWALYVMIGLLSSGCMGWIMVIQMDICVSQTCALVHGKTYLENAYDTIVALVFCRRKNHGVHNRNLLIYISLASPFFSNLFESYEVLESLF